MGILIIILLALLTGFAIFLLYKVFAWAVRKKARIIGLLSIAAVIGLVVFGYYQYFTNMSLVQSKVYPKLYLIKNRDANDQIVHKAIQEKVLELINSDKSTEINALLAANRYKLRFYEYTTGDYGEWGTAYFIDHEERADGMTAELLEYYPNALIAETSVQPCTNDRNRFEVIVRYFKRRRHIKTDTLTNLCGK